MALQNAFSELATETKQDTQIQQITDVTETNVHTNEKELRTFQENHICTDNTTTTPLGANATFTGQWQDCLQYQEVNVSIYADKDSATNGLVFQWSADGVNIGDTDVFSYYTATGGTSYTPNPAFRYVRVIYTNGSQAQGSFSLQTILRRTATGGSFHRIDSTLRDDSDGRLNLSVIKLRTAQNNYVSGTATNSGNFKVSLEEASNGVKDEIYEYVLNDYEDASATVTYIGKENREGTYLITKIDSTTYSLAWTNRATLTYDLFEDVI